jgi:VWFA-related protein
MKTTMSLSRTRRSALLLIIVALVLGRSVRGQDRKLPASNSDDSRARSETSQPLTTLKVTTHMVTVDVVAKDKHGNILPNLTANDFQVFEQVLPKKKDLPQKITGFLVVNPATIAAASHNPGPKFPAGIYTNLISTRLSVPPTILLLDGLNTEADVGMQERRQMVKMLASIPPDTPVAVFMLGRDLVLLQGFTKDPKVLREATNRVLAMDNDGMSVDPHDDPNSLSHQTESMFGADSDARPSTLSSNPGKGGVSASPTGPPGGELQIAALERFEKENVAADTNMRVRITLDALRTIARNVSGYPGRKNLIWISSSFPLTIAPDADAAHNLGFQANDDYEWLVRSTTNALADAKVSVYPVNPAGVQTQSAYQATKAPQLLTYGPRTYNEGRSLDRENEARFSSQQSMTEVADQTGGKICVNDNDLSDCVKTAMEEGSSYYELAYYPDAGDWHGEFHRIIVKTDRPGVQLSFREGYYAHGAEPIKNEKDKAGNDPQMEDAACRDMLTSTSVLVVARTLPPDKAGEVKYYLAIDPHMLTFSPQPSGGRELRMDLAVCSFDSAGKPLQYLQDKVDQKFGEQEYASLHGVPHVIEFAPKQGTARVRLVVRDTASGQLGSLDVPYTPAENSSPAASNAKTPASGPN